MKKGTLLISIILLFISSIKSQSNNSLYPEALRVSSGVYFDATITDRFIYSIKEHQTKPMFELIMENILNGNVKAYSPYDFSDIYHLKTKELSIPDLKKRMGARELIIMYEDTTQASRPMIEKTIQDYYDLKEIKGIHFIDEWHFDAANFTFMKNVVSYVPVRSYIPKGKEKPILSKVCRLNFEQNSQKELKQSNKRLVHYATIQYEQLIENYASYKADNKLCYLEHENESAPFLTSYSKNVLVETIFNKIRNGKKTAYDFKTHEKLTYKDVKKRMGAGDVVIRVQNKENPEGPMIKKTLEGELYLNEIHSYIFTEDWYLDTETLRLVKKVKAIAPVSYYVKEGYNGKQTIIKRIVFEVEFNNQ